jgi:hypothetical protein
MLYWPEFSGSLTFQATGKALLRQGLGDYDPYFDLLRANTPAASVLATRRKRDQGKSSQIKARNRTLIREIKARGLIPAPGKSRFLKLNQGIPRA